MEKNSHNHLETLGYLKDIKNYIEEFQVELEEMKVAFRDYQIMFSTTPLKAGTQGLPPVNGVTHDADAEYDADLKFEDVSFQDGETRKTEEKEGEEYILMHIDGEVLANGAVCCPLDEQPGSAISRKNNRNVNEEDSSTQLEDEEEEDSERKELLPKVLTKNVSNHAHASEHIPLNDLKS